MTNREFFNAISANETLSDEIRTHADERLAALDRQIAARKAAASSKPSKTALENAPLMEQVVEFLSQQPEPTPAAGIAAALDMTTAKVASLCKSLVAAGRVNKVEVKIPKKGKTNCYEVAEQDE